MTNSNNVGFKSHPIRGTARLLVPDRPVNIERNQISGANSDTNTSKHPAQIFKPVNLSQEQLPSIKPQQKNRLTSGAVKSIDDSVKMQPSSLRYREQKTTNNQSQRVTLDANIFDTKATKRQAILERAAKVRALAKKRANEQARLAAEKAQAINNLNATSKPLSSNFQSVLDNLNNGRLAADEAARDVASNNKKSFRQELIDLDNSDTATSPIIDQVVDIFAPVSPTTPNMTADSDGFLDIESSSQPLTQSLSPVSSFATIDSALNDSATDNFSDNVNDGNNSQDTSVSDFSNDGGYLAATAEWATPASVIQRLARSKVTFSFKINKDRIFAVLRYVAITIIIAASIYLAWDTYSTNRAVNNSFSGGGGSSMSIAGINPATADQTAISQEQKTAYTVPSDQPRVLTIPAIGVNARVLSVGVNSHGNIDSPRNLNDTAWYDGSAKPGQEGQVFIGAHTSFSSSIPAAFNDLPKVKKGDKITIEKGNGQKVNYDVVETKSVGASEVDMSQALNPPKGEKKGLTLMTCTGKFNYRTQTSDKRFIVYAVQE